MVEIYRSFWGLSEPQIFTRGKSGYPHLEIAIGWLLHTCHSLKGSKLNKNTHCILKKWYKCPTCPNPPLKGLFVKLQWRASFFHDCVLDHWVFLFKVLRVEINSIANITCLPLEIVTFDGTVFPVIFYILPIVLWVGVRVSMAWSSEKLSSTSESLYFLSIVRLYFFDP